jgi:putative redox protein
MTDTSPAAPGHVTSRATLELETVEGTRMRFAARTGEHSFLFDSGAEAEGPSPMQAVMAALGGCTAMDVISILRKKRQAVTGYTVEVIGERRTDQHPKIFTRLEVVHRVRGHGLSEAALSEAIRLSDTKYCSVHAMLEGAVEIRSRYEIEEG